MIRALRVMAAFGCLGIASSTLAVDIGRTQGSFGVSASGAATYNIPIWTPPGPNGVTPNLSLSYSSEGGNGLGGVGWNLGATSSIERCSRTQHQDGGAAPVALNLSDRFCIGGNRLRLQTGSYGVAGSTYFTEIADYSRITAHGIAGDGPEYFIVEAKNGLAYEYGKTSSSRVVLGTTALRWMLSKVYDRNDNNIAISYNNSTGFAVPDAISWTPTSLGASTYRYEAKFDYTTTRTDKDSYFGKVAGFDVVNRNRLETIRIKSAGNVVRKYRLGYDTSSVTSRSRLTSVKECADDAETNCLMPLAFSYQAGVSGVAAGSGSAPSGSSNGLVPDRYDLNGDGKNDILYVSGGICYATFGTNTGFSAPVSTGATGCGMVDRFMPNGRDAILYLGSPVQVVYWNDATSSFSVANMGFNQSPSATVVSADYDGDGLADLATMASKTIITRRNTSSGSGAPSFSSSTLSSANISGIPNADWGSIWTHFPSGLQKADFNGDGTQDINGVYAQATGMGANVYYVRLLGSAGGFSVIQPINTADVPPYFPALNFNGDACTDVLIGSNIHISPCKNVASSTTAVPAAPLQMLDWDGDGKTDIMVGGGGIFAVYLSTGAGFSGPVSTGISSTGAYFASDVDGDRQDDIIKYGTGSAFSYWTHTAAGAVPTTFATNIPDLLATVTDGFGVSHSPGYVSTAWSSYDKGAATSFPLQESDARIVVAQVIASNGIGGTYTRNYSYVGARDNSERGGFVGFQRVDETDNRNGLISRTYREQTFPVAGMVSQQELIQPNGVTPIKRAVFTNGFTALSSAAYNQRYFTYQSASTATEYEVGGIWNGALLRTVSTANTFETTGGTLYDQTVTTTEPASGANGVTAGGMWTARTYLPPVHLINDTTSWCLGRPQQIQQINATNLTFGSAITRTTNVSWNAAYCRPTYYVAEPTDSALEVTTGIGYDGFGNVNSTTVTGFGMSARTSTTSYSNGTYTTGQFQLSTTNALGQTSSAAWNYDLGVPTSSTDPNGISTSWEYDAYGRRTRENHPDGTYTTWDYRHCGAGAVCDMWIEKNDRLATGTSIGRALQHFDQFDRQIYDYQQRFDGNFNISSWDFDALGNVVTEYFPFKNTESPVGSATTTYDLLSRPVFISRPISDANPGLQTTNIHYRGLTTEIVDPRSNLTIKAVNAAGQLARSTSQNGYFQTFDYDPFGNVMRVQDTFGNTLQSSVYNLRGGLTQRTDMDMGSWSFTSNALGETISQTDAKGQTTTFAFDPLGRLTERQEVEGTSIWTWGNSNAAKNIGRLASVSGPGYSETYIYDLIGRPSSTVISADTTYQIGYTYNSMGALDTLTYPASTPGNPLKLQYEYQYGILKRIKDFNAPAMVYWEAYGVDARNRVTQEVLGNGLISIRQTDAVTGWLKSIQTGLAGGAAVQNLAYEWDLVGNLKTRKDVNQSNLTEEFFYDNVDRLSSSKRNGVTNLDVYYDLLGNITAKSNVGTYTYHATKKHQVVSINNGWSFAYDNNGNMTSGRGSTIEWTSYNYARCIRKGSGCSGTGTNWSSFSYTPDRQYWKQQSNYVSGGSATTIYVGGILEKVTAGGTTDYRHMIRAGNSTVIVSRKSSGTNTVNYVTSDHLGSSSAVTNSSGAVLVNSSFDAFGFRRGSNWSGSPSAGDWTAIASTTRRGYTDHSMLDNMELVHMNGRVQDPVIGRFASADPYITEAGNTQNYNRYSYVYNNPLRFTDPSGFNADECQDSRGSAGCTPEGIVTLEDIVVTGYRCEAECMDGRSDQTNLEMTLAQANATPGLDSSLAEEEKIGEIVVSANRPQTEFPCKAGTQCTLAPNCLGPLSTDMQNEYRNAKNTAFDRFNANGRDKEESFSIFRNDSAGNLLSDFVTGGDSGVNPITDKDGFTLLLNGHIHNRRSTTNFFLLFMPFSPFALEGPSPQDRAFRAGYPEAAFVVIDRPIRRDWQTTCF